MTYLELAAEIIRLPVHERLSLLELVTRSLHEDVSPHVRTKSLAARLRGIARPDGSAPSDAEVREDYTTYLERKYS